MRNAPLSIRVGLALASAVVLGCAETPLPAAPVAPGGPVAAVPASGAPPAPSVDLTPVAEPADIFVLARWRSPGATFSGLGACAGIPPIFVDGRVHELLDRVLARAFHDGVDGRQLADVVALDAPVDLLVSLDTGRRGQPDALFAFSIGLTSLERARQALEVSGPVVELMPGLWRVGPKGSGQLSCAVGPAAGKAPARLVCGTGDRDVSALGPYLTRNLPVTPPPAQDVHAEIRFTTVEARFGDRLRQGLAFLPGLARMQSIGNEHFDKALEEGAAALAAEGQALAGDLDRLTIDARVDRGPTCLKASSALQLRGQSSWLAGLLLDRATKQGPPPALFWRAPVDSETASYSRADGDRAAPILRVLRGLLEGTLARQQIGSDADRRALAGLLASPIGKDTAVVVASGHRGHGPPAPPPPASGGSSRRLAGLLAQGSLGWFMVGLDEGPAGMAKLLKDVVAVSRRKGLVGPLRAALGDDAEALPELGLVAAPASLGGGALDVEIRFPTVAVTMGTSPPSPGAPIVHVLLMGEPKSTWLAVGGDREDLVRRLLAARSGAPDAGTLAARAGLEPLRNGGVVSSSFLTVAAITRGLSNVLASSAVPALPPLQEIADTLNHLPHQGDTPIFLTSTSTPNGPTGELAVTLSTGSVEDVGAILMTLNRLAVTAGLIRP
jgi:hypothetical protein